MPGIQTQRFNSFGTHGIHYIYITQVKSTLLVATLEQCCSTVARQICNLIASLLHCKQPGDCQCNKVNSSQIRAQFPYHTISNLKIGPLYKVPEEVLTSITVKKEYFKEFSCLLGGNNATCLHIIFYILPFHYSLMVFSCILKYFILRNFINWLTGYQCSIVTFMNIYSIRSFSSK